MKKAKRTQVSARKLRAVYPNRKDFKGLINAIKFKFAVYIDEDGDYSLEQKLQLPVAILTTIIMLPVALVWFGLGNFRSVIKAIPALFQTVRKDNITATNYVILTGIINK